LLDCSQRYTVIVDIIVLSNMMVASGRRGGVV
jgi:hypothetical protein